MDYENEISALKRTVLELLDREEKRTLMFQKVRQQYREVKKEYKAVHRALLKKDEVFHETYKLQQTMNTSLNDQINKLSELEDVLEEMS